NLAPGTTINLTSRYPGSSTLSAKVEILLGTSTVLLDADGDPNNDRALATTTTGGTYYARVLGISGSGLLGQYILDVTLTDADPPTVVSSTLPAEGGTITSVFDRFTVTFNEDLNASAVNSSASYDLRAAGPDDAFDTGDDVLYTVISSGTYASGLTAS